MTKQELIDQFNPNDPAENDNIFGLPFSEEHADVVVLPVPWEVTVSYNAGTAKGPEAIKKASAQVDLFDPFVPEAWKIGVWMAPIDEHIKAMNETYRVKALEFLTSNSDDLRLEVNNACEQMVEWVDERCTSLAEKGKKVVLIGGDHSTPLGYIQALAKQHEHFGILQIDAHADLRDAYEGFEFSHASIMYNALKTPQVHKLVQVGVRDYCNEEADLIEKGTGLIKTYFDRALKREQFNGETWANQVEKIISHLPPKVYLSIDIDGLDPKLCPNTGTPVPGGLEFEELLYLLERVVETGHEIIGIDLNEVAPGDNEWDANVGARLLWRLCNLIGKS